MIYNTFRYIRILSRCSRKSFREQTNSVGCRHPSFSFEVSPFPSKPSPENGIHENSCRRETQLTELLLRSLRGWRLKEVQSFLSGKKLGSFEVSPFPSNPSSWEWNPWKFLQKGDSVNRAPPPLVARMEVEVSTVFPFGDETGVFSAAGGSTDSLYVGQVFCDLM